MDQRPNTGEIRCCQIVCKTMLLQEASAEAAVPEALPDVERILDAHGALFLRSRTLEDGCVTLEGVIQGTVLYLGEGEEAPDRVELTIPVTMTAQEEALREAETMTVGAALRTCDARLIHPRKVQFRAEAAAWVTAFRPDTLDFHLRCDDPGKLELLRKTDPIGLIASVSEKSFVVSDEVTLTGGSPPVDRILWSNMSACVRETKPVASKLMLQGEATLELCYLSPGDPQIQNASFSIPFSQLMDMPEEGGDLTNVTLLPTSSFIEPIPGLSGTNSISAELHLTAQAVCAVRREIEYVADAYCLCHPCRIEKETLDLFSPFSPEELSQTLSDTVDLPEKGGEVRYCTACASVLTLTEKTVRLPVTIRTVIRTDSGQLWAAVRRLQAEWRREPLDGESLFSQPAVYDVEALIHGDKLELRCAVTMMRLSAEGQTVTFIRSAQVDDELISGLYEGPSARMVRAGGRTPWELAKTYGSTVELIEAVNPEGGSLLLIPRAR